MAYHRSRPGPFSATPRKSGPHLPLFQRPVYLPRAWVPTGERCAWNTPPSSPSIGTWPGLFALPCTSTLVSTPAHIASVDSGLGVAQPWSQCRPLGGPRFLEDSSDESIRAAVGRAYCLGDQDLQNFCSRPWIQDVKPKILLAQMQLVPPAMSFSGISTPPELMDWSQEDR